MTAGESVRWELARMGMWAPRDSDEAAAARRAARGYRPRRPELTGPELPPRTHRHLDVRGDAVRPGGESDSLEEDDIVEEYEGVRYYLGRRPGMVDEGLELEEVASEDDKVDDNKDAKVDDNKEAGELADDEEEDGPGAAVEEDGGRADDNKEAARSEETTSPVEVEEEQRR